MLQYAQSGCRDAIQREENLNEAALDIHTPTAWLLMSTVLLPGIEADSMQYSFDIWVAAAVYASIMHRPCRNAGQAS